MSRKKNTATEDFLGQLHQMTAEKMMAMLGSPELKAADLAVIVKFLKDNNIQCDIGNESMRKLAAVASDNVRQFPFGTMQGD